MSKEEKKLKENLGKGKVNTYLELAETLSFKSYNLSSNLRSKVLNKVT